MSGVDWVDYMPWWDRIDVGHFAIDMKQWQPRTARRQRRDKVVVLHAPNHREIKGTRFLIRACEELAAEGVPVELELLERRAEHEGPRADGVCGHRRRPVHHRVVCDVRDRGDEHGEAGAVLPAAGSPRAPHALRDGGRLPAREHAAAPDQGRRSASSSPIPSGARSSGAEGASTSRRITHSRRWVRCSTRSSAVSGCRRAKRRCARDRSRRARAGAREKGLSDLPHAARPRAPAPPRARRRARRRLARARARPGDRPDRAERRRQEHAPARRRRHRRSDAPGASSGAARSTR